ncbi:hypothetical protein H0H87_006500 [Tephrocybe sp. NHM501043]|nr:hypothetical protein H0H87_006500 [Tephrocybe sp. NHM501043]
MHRPQIRLAKKYVGGSSLRKVVGSISGGPVQPLLIASTSPFGSFTSNSLLSVPGQPAGPSLLERLSAPKETPAIASAPHFSFPTIPTLCPAPAHFLSPYANSALVAKSLAPQPQPAAASTITPPAPSSLSQLRSNIAELKAKIQQPTVQDPALCEIVSKAQQESIKIPNESDDLINHPELWPEGASFTDIVFADADAQWAALIENSLELPASVEADESVPETSLSVGEVKEATVHDIPSHKSHSYNYQPQDSTPWWSDPPPADWKEKVTRIYHSTMSSHFDPEVLDMDTRVYHRRLRDIPYYLRSLGPPQPGYYGTNHAIDPEVEKEIEEELKAEAKAKRREERKEKKRREKERREEEKRHQRKEKEKEERKEVVCVQTVEEEPVSVSGVCIMLVGIALSLTGCVHLSHFSFDLLIAPQLVLLDRTQEPYPSIVDIYLNTLPYAADDA